MLSKETALPLPRQISHQPASQYQSVHIPGFSCGAGGVGEGGGGGGGASTSVKKKGDSEQQGLFTFQDLFRRPFLPADDAREAKKKGERVDLQPEFAAKWKPDKEPALAKGHAINWL